MANAYDSLVISGLIEVMGPAGGIASDIPELVNAAGRGTVFQLLAPPPGAAALSYTTSYDLGAPQPTTDVVASLLLDGERPFGYRASNRTIHLPVKITAPDQVTLAAAREKLMLLIDQQAWTLSWTPAATALTLEFDCFRAEPTVLTYGFLQNRQPVSVITLSFQALPYGRSDPTGLHQVPFSSPLLGGVAAPPSPAVIDNFGTVSGTNWSRSTTKFVVGPGSAHYTPPVLTFPWAAASYAKSGLSVNATGLPTLSVWFGQSYDTAHWNTWAAFISNVTLYWTLTDNLGHTLSFSRTVAKCRWSNSPANPAWTRITAAIPQGSAVFNYGNVTAYSVRISNWAGGGTTGFVRMHAWLDAVTANPPSLALPASQRGVVYNIMGTAGTARTPFSCQFQLPQSGTVSQELYGSGLWWPPVGVTSVKAECVAAGGSGATRTTAGLGGGGGGGEYAAEAALTVAAGTPVPYACGIAGQPGALQQVVVFTTPGTGSWVCPAGVTAVKAECWGAGAGGAPGGGGGGGGSYGAEPALAVTAGNTYSFVIGAGGSGGGTAAPGGTVNQRNGGKTTFTGNAVTVTGNGGLTGLSGGTTGGAGGAASGNTTHFAGGAGGTAPAGGGGGGGGSGGSAAGGNTGSNGSGNTAGGGAAAVTNGGAGGAGAPSPGWPGAGSTPGGAGGGGFSSTFNGGGGNGAAGQVQLTYTVAGGSPVAGSATTFGSAGTTGTVVTANGGASAALNSATGAAGGSGSTNVTHFSGGAGFTATSGGGGGGGSGGSASAGTAATSSAGAPAVAGGGKGASGGGADQGGGTAAVPGGGGGGADMAATAQTGGQGGAGGILLTWTPPLAQFATLIAHRPGPNAPDSLNPCVPVANTADTPSGLEYSVPSLIAGVNALFAGTYCLSTDTEILTASGWRLPAQLAGGETVLTLNMDTGLSEWQLLSAAHIFPARERKMLSLESANHSSLSTLDHRWPVKYVRERIIQRSSELNSNSGIIRRAVCANPPSEAKYPDALIELVAWYTTEGHRRKNTSRGQPGYGEVTGSLIISQSQRVNAPYVDRIRAALTALYGPPVGKLTLHGPGNTKVTWEKVCEMRELRAAGEPLKLLAERYGLSVSRVGVICRNGAWLHEGTEVNPEWSESYAPSRPDMARFRLNSSAGSVITEHAPGFDRVVRQEFIMSLTRAQLALFLDTCIAADGWAHKSGVTRYIEQQVPGRLDAIEVAALLLGFSTNRSASRCGETLSIGATEVCHPVPRRPRKTTERQFVTYTGQVWCPETPNGTWLARRNGKVFFTGNTVVATNYNWDNPAVSRVVTVVVKQYEYVGGPAYTQQVTRAITPATDIVNGICVMGELTLPVKDIDPSNTSAYFTVAINDTDQLDQWLDINFLDTQGQTVMINIPPGNSYVNFFIDEPTSDRDLGRVMGSDLDRSQAISVLDSAICSGGPFFLSPGDNTLLAYTTAGAPNLGISYLDRWYLDRQS